MNVGQTLHAKRNDILRIAADHGAQNLRVFGSVARNEAGPYRDIDLLVDLVPDRSLFDLIAIKQALEDLLACDVDVLTEAAVSPYIRDSMIHNGAPL